MTVHPDGLDPHTMVSPSDRSLAGLRVNAKRKARRRHPWWDSYWMNVGDALGTLFGEIRWTHHEIALAAALAMDLEWRRRILDESGPAYAVIESLVKRFSDKSVDPTMRHERVMEYLRMIVGEEPSVDEVLYARGKLFRNAS